MEVLASQPAGSKGVGGRVEGHRVMEQYFRFQLNVGRQVIDEGERPRSICFAYPATRYRNVLQTTYRPRGH